MQGDDWRCWAMDSCFCAWACMRLLATGLPQLNLMEDTSSWTVVVGPRWNHQLYMEVYGARRHYLELLEASLGW